MCIGSARQAARCICRLLLLLLLLLLRACPPPA
jgi:hypothetical protein